MEIELDQIKTYVNEQIKETEEKTTTKKKILLSIVWRRLGIVPHGWPWLAPSASLLPTKVS